MILIDPPAWPAHGRLWSHLVSDVSLDELHAFARAQGVPLKAFEGDHYDVPAEHHARLVAAGAVGTGAREVLRALHRAGLRRPKRRGDRVVHSEPRAGAGGVPGRLDAVRADRAPRPRADEVLHVPTPAAGLAGPVPIGHLAWVPAGRAWPTRTARVLVVPDGPAPALPDPERRASAALVTWWLQQG